MTKLPDIEEKFVLNLYQEISTHFNDTRFCMWDCVREFLLRNNNKNLKGLEIGCGSGKNFKLGNNMIGIDNSEEMVNICLKKQYKALLADCNYLPFDDNSFDYSIAIAVFHHLSNESRRIKAINEMIRVLKEGGKGLITFWSVENQENEKKKRHFTKGDNYIKWTNRHNNNKILFRYIHIYNKQMIYDLLEKIKNIKIVKIFNEHGNWIIEFTKTKLCI